MLDAGHGGIDPGTTNGLISREKDVTLAIALKLGKAIRDRFPDIKVVYTRTTDVLPGNAVTKTEGLANRAKIANEARGDLFISIHCDATVAPAGSYYQKRITGYVKKWQIITKGKKKIKKRVVVPTYESFLVKNSMQGATTYIWRADRSATKTSAIDEVDTEPEDMGDSAVTFVRDPVEAMMMAQLYEKNYFFRSALFASLVEEEFQRAGRKTWGVKQRDKGIHVLEATGMPSVLIETGYLSNKEEEEYLNSEAGQNEVVRNILDALRRYAERLKADRSSASPGG